LLYENIPGVPDFACAEYAPKKNAYCLLIPVINENGRVASQLEKARNLKVSELADIVVCDGGSIDGSVEDGIMAPLGVNAKLVKLGAGRLGAQLRMGFWWALTRGYEGVVTADGNDKDGMEAVGRFTECLSIGYDFVQGSRFIKGGLAKNTPPLRHLAIKLIHAPLISLAAGKRYTDTTNAFRAYSRAYLTHPDVIPFREVFGSYELLAYLSAKADRLGLRTCEVPVARVYPKKGGVPTKISFFSGNFELIRILINNLRGKYDA